MAKTLNILTNSLKLTLQELRVNKMRTGLSLTGVAFGIFCIIGVLAAVNSLERNIQSEVKSLGNNTIYIDKWDYSGGPDQPFWKFRSRPVMKYEEADLVRQRSVLLEDISFLLQTRSAISHKDDLISNASVYGIVESQIVIQPLKFEEGRYFSQSEFANGSNICLMGFTNAENLFGTAARALGKQIEVEANSSPILIAKGKEGVTPAALMDELKGIMRQVRRLSPKQDDNFSLNSVEAFSKAITGFFSILNIVGSIIGGISLIVGLFGIANIMFVTVKERTSVIGLKKAIGAKSSSILFEFLLEAVILCLMGGAVGLLFVFIGTKISSKLLDFPIYISIPMLITTIIVCLVVGIVAGIFPASRAAKLDPVVAIRS